MTDWTQRIYYASTLIEAKQVIKDKLRHEGIKLSLYPCKDITEAARVLLKERSEWIGILQVSG